MVNWITGKIPGTNGAVPDGRRLVGVNGIPLGVTEYNYHAFMLNGSSELHGQSPPDVSNSIAIFGEAARLMGGT